MTFDDFNFHPAIADALYYMHFDEPTPVQQKAIPAIMQGRDVMATAQTGTGKTASFVLPVLNRLTETPSDHTDTLIIVPTRELAVQIDQAIQGFSYYTNVSSIAVYGGGSGEDFNIQRKAFKNGVNIVVATPGKLISHLSQGYVDMSHLRHLILDEADRMLDMGFYDDIKRIISFLPKKRQTMMFSATMPSQILKLVKQILVDPVEIKIAVSKPAEGVRQRQYRVFDNQKIGLIGEIIKDRKDYTSILIFSSTKKKVEEIVRDLKRRQFSVAGISSDYDQKQREEVLLKFRARKIRVLVATDVLSRGIDIKDINLIINYDVPGDAEDYVHRIGRTARAATKGEAITFVNKDDAYKMVRIERLIEQQPEVVPLPASLGKGPDFKATAGQSGGNRNKRKGQERRKNGNRNFHKKRKPQGGKKS
jgi:superfamily II DNA/RNA helicase